VALTSTRNGVPVAELVPARKRPFPLGAGRNNPHLNPAALRNNDWWRPMTDEEVEAFLEGHFWMYLLDTHALVCAVKAPEELPARVARDSRLGRGQGQRGFLLGTGA